MIKKRDLYVLIVMLITFSFMFSAIQAYSYPIAANEYNGIFFRDSEVLVDTDASGTVSVGDVFWGVMNVNEITAAGADNTGQTGSQIWPLGGAASPDEISGYFATEVTAIYNPGTVAPPNHPISAGSGTLATIILGAATDPNGILAAGEVMRIYEGSANYDDSSQALALATATDGTLHSSLGLTDGYWYTLAPTVPPGSGDVGESFAGLNYIIDPSFLFNQVNDPNEDYSSNAGVVGGLTVDLFFNAELFSLGNFGTPDGDTLMHFGSNDPAVHNPITVPEPLTLTLLGVGLLGIAALNRKKLSKKL